MSKHNYYYEHQKREEERRKKEIEELFQKWEQEEQTKRTARDAARAEAQKYINDHKTEVEVEIEKKSVQALRYTLENLF